MLFRARSASQKESPSSKNKTPPTANEEKNFSQESSQKKSKNVASSNETLLSRFKQGDLIYGIGDNPSSRYRDEAICNLKSNKFHHIISGDLNREAIPLITNFQKEEEESKISFLSKEEKEHYHFLERHRSYLTQEGGKIRSEKNDPLFDSILRRACKLLIWHASENSRIHFELSGIDMTRVCLKQDKGITGSELRAAYRDSKKQGKNNPFVFFYINGIPCDPPWEQEQYRNLWDSYGEVKREKEEKINLTSKGS